MKIYQILTLFSLLEILASSTQIDNQNYQISEFILDLKDKLIKNDAQFVGIWSKYNALGITSQVGLVGLMDSNCFHYQSFIGQSSRSLGQIFYDCLSPESKTIQKCVAFSTQDGQQDEYKVEINPNEYENVWYLSQLLYYPSKSILEFKIVKENQILLWKKVKTLQFQENYLKLTIGGGLIVCQNKLIYNYTKFKYKVNTRKIHYDFYSSSVSTNYALEDDIFYLKYFYTTLPKDRCNNTITSKISDQDLFWLDQRSYISENINTDSFILAGWFRILEIYQDDDEFIYQFLKMSKNTQSVQFSNPNLAPIQMFYKISPNNNKIIITTYSYNYPSVSLDFTNIESLNFLRFILNLVYIKQTNSKKFKQFVSSGNSFILSEEFEINHKITLWHSLFVNLISNQIFIQIKFFDSYDIYEYSRTLIVKQFREVQFLIQYGNLMKSAQNYLNIQTRNNIFYNCQQQVQQENCHFSCQYCDGPTNTDCLSCSQASQRIYIPEHKACICPYHYLDDQINQNCLSFSDQSFDIQDLNNDNNCKYGYFEYDGSCYACPSIISDKLTTCLECLQNVKGWKDDSQCRQFAIIYPNGVTASITFEIQYLFIFDGSQPYLCYDCYQYDFQNIDTIFQQFSLLQQRFNFFCQYVEEEIGLGQYPDICYECQLYLCQVCSIEMTGIKCIKCTAHVKIIDGYCRVIKPKQSIINPNLSHKQQVVFKECILCPIKQCKYCFEYNKNDLNICTLYTDFEIFEKDEYIRIGCALCEDNFIFDFMIGECIYKQPSLPNCIRKIHGILNYFIQQDFTKMFTNQSISSTDFSVAPEIINCGNLIKNCLQCIITPFYEIKCIICNIGFTASVRFGNCLKNSFVNAKMVIEGQDFNDAMVQRAQSFMMKFLPNQYFIQRFHNDFNTFSYEIECKEGYSFSKRFGCIQGCTSECLNCQEEVRIDYFYCAECSLNQYYQPIRSQAKGQCIRCPELCEICEERSEAEIQKLNPYFKINDNNRMYTYKCIRPISNQNVVIDPYFLIAKYCFTPSCNSEFTFKQSQNLIQIIKLISTIILNFQNGLNWDDDGIYLNRLTELKQQIFSLQLLKFELNLSQRQINNGVITGFDSIEINNVSLRQSNYFQFKNQHQKVNLILKNVLIKQNQINNINSLFDSELFGDITLNNISIINSNFTMSSLFNFNQKLQQGTLKIQKMILQNCNIFNSQLFQFINNQVQIQIEQLVINQTQFTNSSFITFFTNVDVKSKLEVKEIIITSSQFLKSYILNCTNLQVININNLILDNNAIILSTIIAFNKNFTLYETQINNNNFIESYFIATLETESKKKSHCLVDNYIASQNDFTTSSLFYISIENLQYQLTTARIQFNLGQTILEILNN